jgi:hypothetical protein
MPDEPHQGQVTSDKVFLPIRRLLFALEDYFLALNEPEES